MASFGMQIHGPGKRREIQYQCPLGCPGTRWGDSHRPPGKCPVHHCWLVPAG